MIFKDKCTRRGGVALFFCILLAVLALSLLSGCAEKSEPTLTHGDFEYRIIEDGTVEIVGYFGSSKAVVLPTAISGRSVSAVGAGAFMGTDIVSVSFGPFTKRIERYAFASCASLHTVTMTGSIEKIGYAAFSDCSEISALALPKNLTEIGDYAFYASSRFKTLEIPAGVTRIGNNAFGQCAALESVSFAEGCKTSLGDKAFY
ncbi:MAG: leucine-rich repeat domain-containing protein, partial [Clostridia bacterium]|nr:leucine-rich repeat domain-containing protein [Clostridia bacterium]